ncbi:MAG: GxxExxY protein [Bacteroidetes bacterium]|nr:GxxExxY protein [Bacteroidota bacterium]
MTKKDYNDLSYKIIGCAIEVHRQLGPGLLESVYHKCMGEELKYRHIDFQTQLVVPVVYREMKLDTELRLDHLVEDLIIVEYKAVDQMIPLYQAQLMTYLKLLNKHKGLLINFNSENISKNTVSIVTPEFALLPDE